MAGVAQSVRALVCGTGGRGFKPHRSPHENYCQRHPLWCLFLLQENANQPAMQAPLLTRLEAV